jgi:hypothetical protein
VIDSYGLSGPKTVLKEREVSNFGVQRGAVGRSFATSHRLGRGFVALCGVELRYRRFMLHMRNG